MEELGVETGITTRSTNESFVSDCTIETDQLALIPDTYIDMTAEKIRIYKELDSLTSDKEMDQLRKRLEDRFGPMPEELKRLFDIVRIRQLGQKLGFEKIIIKNGVLIAFFVYGMKITPPVCTLMNLFIANMIVDNGLSGIKNGYKFEIITTKPRELSDELLTRLKHGVTEINVHGMYSDTDRYMLVCIINKRQIGEMMKIIRSFPDAFASFQKVNEVFGNFKRKVK
jgi:hypothetical protein